MAEALALINHATAVVGYAGILTSVNTPNAAVLLIGDEEVIVIESHTRGSVQAGADRWTAVATKAGSTIACNRINLS